MIELTLKFINKNQLLFRSIPAKCCQMMSVLFIYKFLFTFERFEEIYNFCDFIIWF